MKDQLWFIVPAAGIGKRMQSQQAKQYLTLSGVTVLEHTLKALLAIEGLSGIVVAVSADDQQWESMDIAAHEKIHSVLGGEERCDSVLAGLDFLQDKIAVDDWVLVHDAARPCIQPNFIDKMILELADHVVGGILAVPASDTLKKVGDDHCIQKTIDRSTIFQAQTPQMFRYGVLHSALTEALNKNQIVTDEASAVEHAGHCPKIVIGHRDNIKITHPDALWLAEMILQRRLKQ